MNTAVKEKIKQLPKCDLHVHLNGLIPTNTIIKILALDKVKVPESINLETDLNVLKPVASLPEYLKPWNVLRLIPKSKQSLSLLVNSAVKNLKKDNITKVELRNSLTYISKNNNISDEEALEWLSEALEESQNKYGIEVNLILSVSRGAGAVEHIRRLIKAIKHLRTSKSLVGLDLSGNEEEHCPNGLAYYFKKAKHEYGLGISIHAGETGNIDNIKKAINDYEADRIGHGIAAYKSKALLDIIRKNDICIEVCPISNIRSGVLRVHDYNPVIKFIQNNIPFVLCSDNPSIHKATLSEDYLYFYKETNSIQPLENMYETQLKYCFSRR